MAYQPEQDQFDSGVYQLEKTDPVLAGLGGVSNTPLLSLANRTKYLYNRIAEILGITKNYALAGGTANAITGAYTPVVSTLVDGMVLKFKGGLANTGAATFTPNAATTGGIAAAPIYGLDHQPLTGGEIVVSGNCAVQWNAALNSGAGAWVLIENSGGIRKGVTPAQFDNSAKAATTAFVSRAVQSLIQKTQGKATNYSVAASDAGTMFYSTAAVTYTLPDASTCTGAVFGFMNNNGLAPTVNTSPASQKIIGENINVSSLTLTKAASSVIIWSDGTNYILFYASPFVTEQNVSPIGAGTVNTFSANYTYSCSATLTAPRSGYVYAWGSTNVSGPVTGGSITSNLTIAGVSVSNDSTAASQSHMGYQPVTQGQVVTVNLTVSTNSGFAPTLAISQRCGAIFLPS